jgi:hypothetical protein
MKIKTWHEYPPIPDRRFDWGALDEDTNSGEDGHMIGWGRTEQEAIDDLYRLMQEKYEWEHDDHLETQQ